MAFVLTSNGPLLGGDPSQVRERLKHLAAVRLALVTLALIDEDRNAFTLEEQERYDQAGDEMKRLKQLTNN